MLNDTYLYETEDMRKDKRVNIEKIKTIATQQILLGNAHLKIV